MAKSGTNYRTSELEPIDDEARSDAIIEEIKKLQVDSVSTTPYNLEEGEVKVRSLFDGRLVYTGQVTGKQYTWNKAGSIVSVSEYDAPLLLEKRIGKQACCGDSRDGVAILEIAN